MPPSRHSSQPIWDEQDGSQRCRRQSLVSTRQLPSGQDTRTVPRPALGSVPYDGVDITSCTLPGKVALTFDDGPYVYTNELLDLLEANGVKATFFVTANNEFASQRPPGVFGGNLDVIKRMHANGHQIGSHTWSHKDLSAISPEERDQEIIWNEMAFIEALGFFPTYLRPPFTSCDWECASAIARWGYHVTDYDVDTKDYLGDYEYARRVFSDTLSSGDPNVTSFISLSHDVWPDTVHSLAQFMIDTARGNGYQLMTLGECVGDPAGNWYRNPATGGPVALSSE
ncbi:polysaccharide deacetylase [Xylariaceae sp. FL0662B]|nr:polysaccharide deacetylase [Xylariaceae sp. FL0662B]